MRIQNRESCIFSVGNSCVGVVTQDMKRYFWVPVFFRNKFFTLCSIISFIFDGKLCITRLILWNTLHKRIIKIFVKTISSYCNWRFNFDINHYESYSIYFSGLYYWFHLFSVIFVRVNNENSFSIKQNKKKISCMNQFYKWSIWSLPNNMFSQIISFPISSVCISCLGAPKWR